MSALTTNEFLDFLKRSALLDEKEYDTTIADIKQESPKVFNDSNLLASEFVKRGLLTNWHIRQLMKRKYKGFYLRQYRILGHLGSGGMSSVYLGEHTVMKRRVAIKVLPKRRLNSVYLDRFAREAQAIASLDSQYVVRAYDVDRFEDVHYIVMEYFEGQNLRQLVEKEGPLDYEDAANYIRQAALGLADAHKSGIVHRDVKPENIVVDEHDFVKILDLGLALLDEGAFAINGTMFDEDKILGTADYLAPEQALNSHNVDARADVYGLGATLYFCLTGKPPFPFGTISERLLAHQRKEPASIFNERPDAPSDLVEICTKMMAKKPKNRVQTALDVADMLQRWLIKHGFAHSEDFTLGSDKDVDNDASYSDVEQQFLNSKENATELVFGREEPGFRLSDAELFSVSQKERENSVDLYDGVSESGASHSKLSRSSIGSRISRSEDNFVLSKRVDLSHTVDPLEMALSEIADTTKSRLATDTNQNSTEDGSSINSNSQVQIFNLSQFKRESSLQRPLHEYQTDESKDSIVPLTSSQQSNSENVSKSGIRALQNIANSNEQYTTSAKPTEQMEEGSKKIPNTTSWYREVPIWFWTVAIGGYAVAIFLAGILFTLLLNLK